MQNILEQVNKKKELYLVLDIPTQIIVKKNWRRKKLSIFSYSFYTK